MPEPVESTKKRWSAVVEISASIQELRRQIIRDTPRVPATALDLLDTRAQVRPATRRHPAPGSDTLRLVQAQATPLPAPALDTPRTHLVTRHPPVLPVHRLGTPLMPRPAIPLPQAPPRDIRLLPAPRLDITPTAAATAAKAQGLAAPRTGRLTCHRRTLTRTLTLTRGPAVTVTIVEAVEATVNMPVEEKVDLRTGDAFKPPYAYVLLVA